LIWNTDGSRVFFGIKEQEDEPEKKKTDADSVANVDIWHWKDERIQSVQMKQAERDRNFTYRSVYDMFTNKYFRLADENMREVMITKDGKWGVGVDYKPYLSDWKPRLGDYYRLNLSTGEKKIMIKALERRFGLSPDSKHFLYWKDGHVWGSRCG